MLSKYKKRNVNLTGFVSKKVFYGDHQNQSGFSLHGINDKSNSNVEGRDCYKKTYLMIYFYFPLTESCFNGSANQR